jgi:hypothetical protein
MTAENSSEKSWFSDLSWKTAVVCGLLSVIVGGSSGAGVVATKAVQTNGITQDQADVRYLSKTEAEARSAARDKQFQDIRKEMLTREVFEAYYQNLKDEQMRQRQMLERLLEK